MTHPLARAATETLAFELQPETHRGNAFGLIVLSVDETIETELTPLFARDDTVLHHARIESEADVTAENLMKMKARLAEAAALLPRARALDCIGYACTSGATVIGSDQVAEAMRTVFPGAQVSDPARAAIAALRHLGARRIALVSPYVAEVSDALCALLCGQGITPAAVASFGQSEEAVVARIAPSSVAEAICHCGADSAIDAVFASCTNLRSFEVIEDCEARLGKPVLSSNQVLAWHMMVLAGLDSAGRGPGRLFASGRPDDPPTAPVRFAG